MNASPTSRRWLAAALLLALLPIPASAQQGAAAEVPKGTVAAELQLEELDGDIPVAEPAAFLSGSYSSTVSTRVGRDGRIDTGLGLLEIVDGHTGAALDSSTIDTTRGPGRAPGFGPFWWAGVDEDVVVSVQLYTVPVVKSGDARMVNALRIQAENMGGETVEVPLGIRLFPGGLGGRPRIRFAHPFDAGTRYELVGTGDDRWLLRDGMACLWWEGPEAEETLNPVSAPDDVAYAASWTLSVPPGEQRSVDVFTASPPCNDDVAEQDWREMVRMFGFRSLSERVTWEAEWRTDVEHTNIASQRMWHALVASMHTLRMLAEGYNGLRGMTDRPYGVVDVGFDARAGVTAAFHEWNVTVFTPPPLAYLVENIPAQMPLMTPKQRVAYLHGIARIVRLIPNPEHDLALADAILEHLQPAAVESWQDPALVKADLESVLRRAGRSLETWPELTWDTYAPGTADAEFQAWRRAISAGDADAAWAACKTVLARTDSQGIGSVHPDGEPDGRFAHVYLHLVREMLFDDHGDGLVLFPAVPEKLYPRLDKLDSFTLPTAFGTARARAWYIGPKAGGMGFAYLLRYKVAEPAYVHWRIPPGRRIKRIQELLGGTVEEVEPGLLDLTCDLSHPLGVNFVLRMQRVEG